MGASQSSLAASHSRPIARPDRSAAKATPDAELNEKFQAVRLNDDHLYATPAEGVLSEADSVSRAKAEGYIRQLLKDPKNRLGLSALSTNNPNKVLEIPSTILKDGQIFNVAIPREGSPITDQDNSGRCWIFAATNVFRIAIQQKYDIKEFELSQAYLFFWDQVEKANYFLESILDSADEDIESRLVSTLTDNPVQDGGQWDMIVNLVSKYGIVPQALYPDSWNAHNTTTMTSLLTSMLREDALRLRSAAAAAKGPGARTRETREMKDRMMQDVVRVVTLCLGPPPAADDKFTWEFYTGTKQYKSVSLTPLEFADTTHVKRFISLVNDPRNDLNRLLTVDHLSNVWGGRQVTYVNVDKEVLKQACVGMLKKGLPVFFGSDVGKQSDGAKGIMDTDLVDYELGFNVKLQMSKAERLRTGESKMNHAMVLTAVHLDKDGSPVRWRVENSWSASYGTEGYFVMSDPWMDEFCYQAVVDPSVVDKSVRDVLKQEPKVLPLWDPMGALA
ncbi:peptidase C1B, bleomycin hydrolase [Stachybotrys elegans]|uniref:Cysteine proteinase 1, mitochondrial n=1 Tax=Stachybotrys elegans TaxID=80388 RepID=A0A8K0SGF5_9HYPO|nr:peptidase C1B, bleomycin hydrolase [Stachybotrys elegans]